MCMWKVTQNKKIAILDPAGNVSNQIREIVREEISSSILSIGGYTVLERSHINEVLKASAYQLSDLFDNSQAAEVGKLMNANYVFLTSLSLLSENNYYISCKLIEVSTARIDKQATGKTKQGMNDLIATVQKAINEMFQKETTLTLQGRKIFASNILLDDKKIQGLMANTEALKYYNKSKSQRKTGTGLVWAGIAVFVAGVGYDLVNNYDSSYGQFPKEMYVKEGDIIYRQQAWKLQGVIIGGAAGVALVGTGIILRSSSKKSLQKSVDTYNSNKRTAQTEIKWGFTGNGIGLAINF